MNTATTNTCVSVCAYSLYAQTDKQVYSLRQNMLTSNFRMATSLYQNCAFCNLISIELKIYQIDIRLLNCKSE